MKTRSSFLRTPLLPLALLVFWAVVAGCDGEATTTLITGRPPETAIPDAAPHAIDGLSCLTDGDCESGVCAIYYRDADGDGYGTGAIALCGREPGPGMSTHGGDCCDWAADAHPGAMAYHQLPNACGTYDYDCDGVDEKDRPATLSCGSIEIDVSQVGGRGISAVACR